MKKLGDVCTKGTSNVAQKDLGGREGIYPIYGASGFIKNVDFYHQEKPYIAIVKDGAGVGRVMRLPAKSSVIGTMQYIIPEDGISVEYLAYALEHMNLSKYYLGAAIPHIYFKDYCNELLPPHTEKEQEYISHSLSLVCDAIALRKEQLSKLDELVKSRFVELFDGKHETKPLQAVCEELFAGGDVKKDKSSDTQSEEYPYPIYTNGEKDNGLYGYTSIVRVANEAVTISGRGTIGFTCLRKEPFYPAVRLIVAVPKQELVSGCYLQHFIQSKNYGGQGASIPQLTVPMIKDEPIPVPPIELQEQFAAFVEQTDKSKLAVQQSLEKLETLKKALMQKYFG